MTHPGTPRPDDSSGRAKPGEIGLSDLRSAIAAGRSRSELWSLWLRLSVDSIDIGLALLETAHTRPQERPDPGGRAEQ